jgi:hypothetical protein
MIEFSKPISPAIPQMVCGASRAPQVDFDLPQLAAQGYWEAVDGADDFTYGIPKAKELWCVVNRVLKIVGAK